MPADKTRAFASERCRGLLLTNNSSGVADKTLALDCLSCCPARETRELEDNIRNSRYGAKLPDWATSSELGYF